MTAFREEQIETVDTRGVFTEDQFAILEHAFCEVLYLFDTVRNDNKQDLRLHSALQDVLVKKGVVTDEEVDEEDEAIAVREGSIFWQIPPVGEEYTRTWRLNASLRSAHVLFHHILNSSHDGLRKIKRGER